MIHRLIAAFAIFMLAGSAAALAVTREYRITVPVQVTHAFAGTKGEVPFTLGITVHCAVGPASMAYSTGSGSATDALGDGSVHATLKRSGSDYVDAQPIIVVVTDSKSPVGKGATRYVCWGILDQVPGISSTPVNFVDDAIPPSAKP